MEAVRPGMGTESPRGTSTGSGAGGPRARKKLGVQPPLHEERRPARATLTLSVRQGGQGAAKKYASYLEEEEYPSVIGAGVLARRVKDVAPPGHYGSASAGRSVTITASKVRAQGLFDLWDAIRHPGGENGDTPWVDWAHAGQDPVPLP